MSYVVFGTESGFLLSPYPTSYPSSKPSGHPASKPSGQPTIHPSIQPTNQPSSQPSIQPINEPSSQPSSVPSSEPTNNPSSFPTAIPTSRPSRQFENIYNFDFQTALFSTIASLMSGLAIYLAPSYILRNWGYKFKYVFTETDKDSLLPYEVGILKEKNQLIALHRKNGFIRQYLIETVNTKSNGITIELYNLISEQLTHNSLFKRNPVSSTYKYIYDDAQISSLKENEVGLKFGGIFPSFGFDIFCNSMKMIAFTSINGKIEEIPIKIGYNNQGINKGLYQAIASEYYSLSNSFFTAYEENQLRDFLLTPGRMKPGISVFQKLFCLYTPIYTDLGKAPGFFHNILNFHGYGPEILYDFLSLGGTIPGLLYGLCFNFLKKYQIGVNARISEDSFNAIGFYIDSHFKSVGEVKSVTNVILQMKKDDLEELPNAIEINTSSFEQASKSLDMVDSTKKDKTCILMSIDAMVSPEHLRLQNAEFLLFVQNINLIAHDFNKQFLRITDVFESKFKFNLEYLSHAKTSIEFYPLGKTLADNVLSSVNSNYTFPEISNTLLVTAHMGLGHLNAALSSKTDSYSPYVVSFASSAGFSARLALSSFVKGFREDLATKEQTISSYEAIKHCASVVLSYTLPDLFICAAAKAAMPTYQCDKMNLWNKFSFAGSECYSVYKASQGPTTEDAITPLIIDTAVAIASYANGDGVFETITNVVAADWIGRAMFNFLESE